MTRTQLKALIEPTQDGAKFATAWRASDWLMLLIEREINSAEELDDVYEKLNDAKRQLERAARLVYGLSEQAIAKGELGTLTDDDAPTVQSGGEA